MNNYFDFNSKKYTILLLFVLFLFTIFVIKIFEYLPSYNSETNNIAEAQNFNVNTYNEINKNEAESDYQKNEEESEEEYSIKHKSGHIDFMPKYKYKENDSLDEIKAPSGTNEEQINIDNYTQNSDNNESLNYYLAGQKYKSTEDDSNALKQFQRVINTTSNNELKAMSYEAIAEIYANHKKYDVALTFANKAYDLSPSNSRKVLISRIQYMSGDTESSIRDINTLLQKGF